MIPRSILVNNEFSQRFSTENELRQLHLSLNKMYHSILFNSENNLVNELCFSHLNKLENQWFEIDKKLCISKYNCNAEVKNELIVEVALKSHPVFNHPLFDYLCDRANNDEIKHFLLNDSILNLEFFDYLALALIGVSDTVKLEIITNLWDEAGRGNLKKFHTVMFMKILEDLGLNYKRDVVLENMTWEGLAGINLFSYLALYSTNKMKYFGLLAATEMLDPAHYTKLIKGIKRIFGQQKIDLRYYVEHSTIDIIHSKGWLQNIILPELAKNPNKTQDFWLGFYMRLDSTLKYYDKMMELFSMKMAA